MEAVSTRILSNHDLNPICSTLRLCCSWNDSFLGHINHSLFWKNLAPSNAEGGKIQNGPFKSALERDFGSVEKFKQIFNTQTAAIQGSGWGWLVSVTIPIFRFTTTY
jgi:superoxide dismutase